MEGQNDIDFVFERGSKRALAQADPTAAHYDVAITQSGEAAAEVRVSVRFRGDSDGETNLYLPNAWGGETELWTGLTDLTVASGNAELLETDTPAQRLLRHAPGAPLELNYTIIQDWDGVPTAGQGNDYRPVVNSDYVHLLGDTWVVDVATDQADHITVTASAPDDWALATDLTHQTRHDPQTLHGSVLVAGDFRIETRQVENVELRIALRGAFDFSDSDLTDMVEAAMHANHAYWGAGGQPYFVTILPLEAPPDRMSVGGTGLGDAFAFFATPNAEANFLFDTLTHEHNHSWVPGQLGAGYSGMGEPAGYWFSEGFTEFVTYRAGVLGGLWDAASGVERWNSALAELAQSPHVAAPNSVITEAFWTDQAAQRLPYRRGLAFGMLADHAIRTQTNGRQDLDDVLFHMRDTFNGTDIGAEIFVGEILEQTGVDLSDAYQAHILDGEPITLPADTFGACGELVTLDQPVYDYGMSLASNETGQTVIAEVDPNGPAAPAGFEAGMIILERLEGAPGDPTRDSVLRVEQEGEQMDLRYRATNGETYTLQQIIPVEGDLDSNGCAAVLAGTNRT